MQRVVVWFSCGAASAVAAKMALSDYGATRVTVVNCDTTNDEHPDNARFFDDVERWLGVPILRLRSTKYADVDDVISQTRYMAGVYGARCTVELKKVPRFEFQRADDIHVFGYTADEPDRIDRFAENNPELQTDPILWRHGYTKDRCLLELRRAGIALPAMYVLGYRNNNCLGCLKATSARYWNMIRRDFPKVFEKRARQSRELGVKLTRVRRRRVFLDELPADYMPSGPLEDLSCGPECRGISNNPPIKGDTMAKKLWKVTVYGADASKSRGMAKIGKMAVIEADNVANAAAAGLDLLDKAEATDVCVKLDVTLQVTKKAPAGNPFATK